MKVYDCFTFYNEFELLELRLKALWDVVDYFVIVEADRTHTNKPKPYYFLERQDDFRQFFPKIRHLPGQIRIPYKGVGDWQIENAQRNAIMHGLFDAEPDDLIMVSDLDEIPAPDVICNLNAYNLLARQVGVTLIGGREEKLPARILMSANDFLEIGSIALIQKFHCYYFDWVNEELLWFGTSLTKRKNLTTPQELRVTKSMLLCADGGWHFSYMGGAERVINKMNSIVDGNELVVKSDEKLIDKRRVEESIAKGTDVYNRVGAPESQFVPFDVKKINLPCLNEFLRKYPYLLREPEKYFGT